MITIKQIYEKQKVIFSNPGSGQRGVSVICRNWEEVHMVIDHYELRPHDKKNCPLCKQEK